MPEGFLGFDPEQLKQMMAQFGATPQDTADANKQAAFALGFGLLQGRKGNELATIGQAGMGAMGARNASLMNSQQLRQEGLKNALGMAKLAEAARAQQAGAAQAQEMAGAFQSGPQLQNMGPGGPTPANAAAVAPPSMIEQYRKASVIAATHGNSEAAKRYADIANQMEAEYSTTPQTMKDPSGNLASVLIGKRGETKKLDYLPAEKLHFADTGAMTGVGINQYTGKPESAGLPKMVDPNTQFTGNITMRGQNMTDARSREANAAAGAAGSVVETANGFVRIGKDNTVTPIVAGGVQLQPKPTGAIAQQIASNTVTLGKVDRAIAMVNSNPGAFGAKNYLGDSIRQRTDPSGVTPRALIADIAGQKIHDRSGAAVTVGESERLKPYVPNVTDAPDAIAKKLSLFKTEYAQMQRELMGGKSLADVGASPGRAAAGVIDFSQLPK